MQADLGFDIGPYTFAEAWHMWTISRRNSWQHTSTILSKLEQVNSKNGRGTDPQKLNPFENTTKTSTYNIREDRSALKALADGKSP